jgi:hypothetical protein
VAYHVVIVDLEKVEFVSVGHNAVDRSEAFVFSLSGVMAVCYDVLATFRFHQILAADLPMNDMHWQRTPTGHGLTQMTTPIPLPGSAALFTTKSSSPLIGNLTPKASASVSKPLHLGMERTAAERLAGFCLR